MRHALSLLAFALITAAPSVRADNEKKLFTMEKNHNPENIMVIHTQTDSDCRFVPSSKNTEGNYVEFYWLMAGQTPKEVHPMIRGEIKKRVVFEGINATRDSFKVRLTDLSELKHDLSDPTMEVVSEVTGGKCAVKSVITLGPSARYRKIDLDRTFCDVSKNFVGLPNGCNFLDLEGKDIATGEAVKVRFKKK